MSFAPPLSPRVGKWKKMSTPPYLAHRFELHLADRSARAVCLLERVIDAEGGVGVVGGVEQLAVG